MVIPKMINLQSSDTIKLPKWLQHLKICPKVQIPYYHSQNVWLLGCNQCQPYTSPMCPLCTPYVTSCTPYMPICTPYANLHVPYVSPMCPLHVPNVPPTCSLYAPSIPSMFLIFYGPQHSQSHHWHLHKIPIFSPAPLP